MAEIFRTGVTEEAKIRRILREEGYFNIFRWCDDAGTRYGVHSHPYDEVRWILSGTLVIEEEGRVLELRPGDRMQSKALTPHSAWAHENVCYICGSKKAF